MGRFRKIFHTFRKFIGGSAATHIMYAITEIFKRAQSHKKAV